MRVRQRWDRPVCLCMIAVMVLLLGSAHGIAAGDPVRPPKGLADVQRVIETLKDSDVVILPIAIDKRGANAVQPYMTENKLTFPALLDQRQKVARQFGVRGTLTTVVVNRAGQIIARGMGPADMASTAFQQYLRALLAQSDS